MAQPIYKVIFHNQNRVEKEGACKISESAGGSGNISAFPMPGIRPTPHGGDE
jgi:hypothetical protein